MSEKSTIRNVGLDLIRSLAIVSVLIHHWKHHLTHLIPNHSYLLHFFGYYGVEIFFVLSGFLIGNILIRNYINEKVFNFKVITKFWGRRWFRTLPLYYVILIFNVIVEPHKDVALWKYFFFLQNVSDNPFSFFPESWSLCIEEWFYITFPLLLWGLNSVFSGRLSTKRIILLSITGYILFFTIVRIIYNLSTNVQWNLNIRPVLLFRLDAIGFGVLGAYLYNFHVNVWTKYKKHFLYIGILFIVITTLYFEKFIASNYYYKTGDTPFFAKTIYFSMVNFGFLLMIPFTSTLKINVGFIKRPILYISKVSYSVYLINLYFVYFLNRHMSDRTLVHSLAIFFVFVIINLVVAYIPYLLIEKTFLKLRDRILVEKYRAS